MPKPCPIENRFHDKYRVDEDTGCWVWIAYRDRSGYGKVNYRRKMTQAYRVAYILLIGPIPSGKQLDHLCRNRACVNPDHLEVVDARTNTLRGNTMPAKWVARTHCNYGHPFDEQNTRRYGPDNRWRECRTCAKSKWKSANKKAWAKHKAAKEQNNDQQP